MDNEKIKLTLASVRNFETEVDYTTVLDNFEGPLDLLLHLIKQEEIEIKDGTGKVRVIEKGGVIPIVRNLKIKFNEKVIGEIK